MAEFCLECFNKLNQTQLTEKDVTLTDYDDLCEGCGKILPVISSLSPEGFFGRWKRRRKQRAGRR